MIKTAMIMAAGMGTRFGHYTEMIPKGFVEVGNTPMIIQSIETLISCGIERIVIGTGYKREVYEALKNKYPQVECHYSPRYADTNSMYTLYNTRTILDSTDFLLLESDLIFEKKAITSLLDCPQQDVMLITPVTKFQDQYYIEYDGNHRLTNCSVNRNEVDAKGELVGIHKLSNSFFQKMCNDYSSIATDYPKLGYEYELLRMSRFISPVYVIKIDDLKWYEIDDEADKKYAEKNIIPQFK
ncbi:phosphocholine cytidylyltransferase family protein [Parabacteroides faecis]|uniref:phosphocholine cytidylyltransferase family protein n=1 Tax=Parabacteroides faecis TaxID=1217282 RepID=UPI00352154D2